MHILFIDDDHEDVQLFVEIIHGINPNAECRSITSYETLHDELVKMETQDLIFVDGHLGPMTGKQSLQVLQKIVDPTRTKIVIHTGGIVTEQQEREYRELGADRILIKGTLYSDIRANFVKTIESLSNSR